jgi:parallel beta-helix repeat protein
MDTSVHRTGSVSILLALVSLTVAVAAGRAATIIVPDDNPSLPAAVAAASAGDTIQVRPGDYPDRVTVVAGQDGLTIEGLGGRPRFPGANRKEGFRVVGAANVTIRGFDFDRRLIAVRLTNCTGCVVDDITVTGSREGMRIKVSNGVIVVNSRLTDVTDRRAIRIDDSPNAAVLGNLMTTVKSEGIALDDSPGSLVIGNTVTGASRGIRLRDSAGTMLSLNVFSSSRREGVVAANTDGLIVTSNQATGNGSDGYRLSRLTGSTIQNNDATGNGGNGFDVRLSPPFATEADLTAAGNTASGNVQGDFLVVD